MGKIKLSGGPTKFISYVIIFYPRNIKYDDIGCELVGSPILWFSSLCYTIIIRS